MEVFDFSRVDDDVLLRDLLTHNGEEQAKSATVIAEIAEVDARRLYVPAGYTSMHAYCVHVLHLSEYAAYRRIQAARAGRRFPRIFQELSTGRLHLAAVCLLVPHLTSENADELIGAAIHRTKADVEQWLVRRFPASRPFPSAPATIRPIGRVRSYPNVAGDLLSGTGVNTAAVEEQGASSSSAALSADQSPGSAQDGTPDAASTTTAAVETAPQANSTPPQLAPGQVESQLTLATTSPETIPEVLERFQVCFTINGADYDRLRYAQRLMSHSIPQGDVAKLLMRGIEMLIAHAERRKLGSARAREDQVAGPGHPRGAPAVTPARPRGAQAANSAHPRNVQAATSAPARNAEVVTGRGRPGRNRHGDRYIPARTRRAVWSRDQGRCTFIGTGGHRCGARHRLEFDHVLPVARGGEGTLSNLRLRCRAHNQHEAERAFGSDFIAAKREQAVAQRGQTADKRGQTATALGAVRGQGEATSPGAS